LILEDDFQLAAGFSDKVPMTKALAETHGFIRLEKFERGPNRRLKQPT
jgi:hypothetical protein